MEAAVATPSQQTPASENAESGWVGGRIRLTIGLGRDMFWRGGDGARRGGQCEIRIADRVTPSPRGSVMIGARTGFAIASSTIR